MRRRTFLQTSTLGFCAWASRTISAADSSSEVAEAFDAEMEAFMQLRRVPGGALAVVKRGRLVYAKGYGLADRDNHVEVSNDSLFRIASLSKPITAVAVLQLVESERLSLEACPFELLGFDLAMAADPRLANTTVRQLLHHTGGWDRDKSFDPMFRPLEIARRYNLTGPAKPDAVIRYMFERNLDFEPGEKYAYSNFGYCVLGRVIEKVTGLPYEQYVQEKVLIPAGIRRMRIGATLASGRAPEEVCYYTEANKTVRNVFDESGARVPHPYGGFYLEAMDAHGGWIASATDLVRFAEALGDPPHCTLLQPESLRLLYSPPAPPVSRKSNGKLQSSFYGCGWSVRPVGADGANYWHTGSLPGTATLLVRRYDGLSWAVCFNQRSDNAELADSAIDPALHRAANRVKSWPDGASLIS